MHFVIDLNAIERLDPSRWPLRRHELPKITSAHRAVL
jgi:hypothetical protein